MSDQWRASSRTRGLVTRCIENFLYKEWCNYLEEDYFRRFYARREFGPKLSRLFEHYRTLPPRPLIYLRQVMRIQFRYYYLSNRAAMGEPVYTFSTEGPSSEQSSASVCHDTNNLLASLQEVVPPPLAFKKKDLSVPTPKAVSARREWKRVAPKAVATDESSLEESFRKLRRMLDQPSLAECSGFSVVEPPPATRARVFAIPRAVHDLTTKKHINGYYSDEYQLGSSHEQTKVLSPKRRNCVSGRNLPSLPSTRLAPPLTTGERISTRGQRVWQRLTSESDTSHRPCSSPSDASTMFRSASTQFGGANLEADGRFPRSRSRTGNEFRPSWTKSAKKNEEDAKKRDLVSHRVLASSSKFHCADKALSDAKVKRKKLADFLAAKVHGQAEGRASVPKKPIKSSPMASVTHISVSRQGTKTNLHTESPNYRNPRRGSGVVSPPPAHHRSSTASKIGMNVKKTSSGGRASHAALPRSENQPVLRCRRSQSELRLQRPLRHPVESRESVNVARRETPGVLRKKKTSATGGELRFAKVEVAATSATTPATKRFQLRLVGPEAREGSRKILITNIKTVF